MSLYNNYINHKPPTKPNLDLKKSTLSNFYLDKCVVNQTALGNDISNTMVLTFSSLQISDFYIIQYWDIRNFKKDHNGSDDR